MTQTFIPGKDAALETSLVNLRGAIEGLGYHIEEARWLNPAPISGRYIFAIGIALRFFQR